jgi:aminocarboxymuconate-semialdehyde decarboxylase
MHVVTAETAAETEPEAELIDVHTHVVPEIFPAYLGKHSNAPWPSMAPAQACHRHVMVSGAVFRTVSHQCWDCAVRTADMDARGVGRQVLSPMPELLSYWMAPEDGAAMCRYLNEVIATMVANAPARFFGLGAVPLQDVPLAIRELERVVKELGLSGVEIAGNVSGRVIGDPIFLPFFEAAAKWGAAVFVHPLRPTGMERLVGPPALEQVLAFPGETGLAAASLITGGTLERVPNLRIAFSHGGGTLSALLPRLQHAWKSLPPVRTAIPADPTRIARRMYFDDLVYDAASIHRLIDVFGASQILVGSDYPFAITDDAPADRVESLNLPIETRAMLRSLNARRWLGLEAA